MQSDLEWHSGAQNGRLPESALPAREEKEGVPGGTGGNKQKDGIREKMIKSRQQSLGLLSARAVWDPTGHRSPSMLSITGPSVPLRFDLCAPGFISSRPIRSLPCIFLIFNPNHADICMDLFIHKAAV